MKFAELQTGIYVVTKASDNHVFLCDDVIEKHESGYVDCRDIHAFFEQDVLDEVATGAEFTLISED